MKQCLVQSKPYPGNDYAGQKGASTTTLCAVRVLACIYYTQALKTHIKGCVMIVRPTIEGYTDRITAACDPVYAPVYHMGVGSYWC